jgi:hypothetical protein
MPFFRVFHRLPSKKLPHEGRSAVFAMQLWKRRFDWKTIAHTRETAPGSSFFLHLIEKKVHLRRRKHIK